MPDGFSASLEPVSYVLRVHAAGQGYGAPYVASATVIAHGPVAHIVGLTVQGGRFGVGHWRAVFAALGRAGFTGTVWERRADGQVRTVRRNVPQPPLGHG